MLPKYRLSDLTVSQSNSGFSHSFPLKFWSKSSFNSFVTLPRPSRICCLANSNHSVIFVDITFELSPRQEPTIHTAYFYYPRSDRDSFWDVIRKVSYIHILNILIDNCVTEVSSWIKCDADVVAPSGGKSLKSTMCAFVHAGLFSHYRSSESCFLTVPDWFFWSQQTPLRFCS